MNRLDRITRSSAATVRGAGYGLLAILAYVPPLLTARGRVSADTKSYLYLDPGRMLERASSMWDPNIGMGTVTHQNIGYLFPMGPYYWSLDRIGVPDWVAQRLWLGSLILVAALGVLSLSRHLGRAGPGVVVAALAYSCSPYSLHYSARLSVLLMPWAALGFLIALVIRALREGGWRAPLLFAFVVQIVGGVNATALVFAGIAPILWIAWAWLGAREVSLRGALATVGRIGAATIAMSLWWIAGLATQSGYGIDILRYTETVAVVARTSTPNEVLRGLGYWFFYGRDRLGPWVEGSAGFTQSPGLIALTYGLVAVALVGAVMVRWRHRGYFTWLLLVGTIVAVGAHPFESPTPLGAVFKAFATSSTAGLALRSTPRAVPLVTLATAMFLGSLVDAVVVRARESRWPQPRVIAVVGMTGALVLAAFPPSWNGSFYGENLLRDEEIPGYWAAALETVDRGDLQSRVIEIPGSDFAAYRWGDTVDPISPGLIDRPYVARELIPYGSPASADLLNALDRRLQEGTLDATGLVSVLRRMGVGTVVVRNDLEWLRYNLVRPREVATLFRQVEHEGTSNLQPRRSFGARLPVTAEYPKIGTTPVIDERSLLVRRPRPMPAPVVVFDLDDPGAIVTAEPLAHQAVVSGDGEGLIDATDVGALPDAVTVLFAGSLTDAELMREVARSPVVVVTDSNRRRGRRWSTLRDNQGETETAGQQPLADDLSDARLPIFSDDPRREPAGDQSVIEYLDSGGPAISMIRATGTGNPIAYTPEDRPARAFDGDLDTSWKTSAFDRAVGDRIELTLAAAISTDRIDLVQVRNGPTDRFITRARVRFDGDEPIDVELGPESRAARGQTITFGLRTFARLTIEVLATNRPDGPLYSGESAVGFAEIILAERDGRPARAHEVVRVPRDATDALAASGARPTDLVYVFSRLRVQPVPPRYDEELSLDRRFDVPYDASFRLRGEARENANPYEPDRIASERSELSAPYTAVRSSGALVGCGPWCAAGAAFDADSEYDGDGVTAWQPPIGEVRGSWLEIESSRPVAYDHLDLSLIADGRHSLPTRLRITIDDGSVEVPVPRVRESRIENATAKVRVEFARRSGTRLHIEIVDIDARLGASYYDSNPRELPVGIAGTGLTPHVREPFPFDTDLGLGECRFDLVRLDGEPLPIRTNAPKVGPAFDARPMRVETCDAQGVRLTAGTHTITTARGVDTGFDIDRLMLSSSTRDELPEIANADVPTPTLPDVRQPRVTVVDAGRTRLRVEVTGAEGGAWLRLGQSFNEGWTARIVGGRSLGAPTLIDGYANGWRIDPSDGSVEVVMEWNPQRRVRWSIWGSLLAVVVGLGGLAAARRRHGRVLVPAREPVSLVRWSDGVHRPATRPRARFFVVVGAAIAGGVVIAPAVGIAMAVLSLLATWRRPFRHAVAVLAPASIAACGAYVAIQQMRFRYQPIFEWPTLFPRARTIAWIAALLPAVVWLIDEVHDRRATGRRAAASPDDGDHK